MIKPAQRLKDIKEYYFSTKLREISELNRRGKNIINMGIGNPDLSPPEKVRNALKKPQMITVRTSISLTRALINLG